VEWCEGTTSLRNVGNDLPVNTAFHPKNTNSWSETKTTLGDVAAGREMMIIK